jgi:hypothetical protein
MKAERRCYSCGYDATGLPTNSKCPECGTAVPDAREADDRDMLDMGRMTRRRWRWVPSFVFIVFVFILIWSIFR